MMNQGRFFDQIGRLTSAYNWKMSDAAIGYWFKELKDRNYSDEDVKAAITRIIFVGGGARFPSLGDLDKACREVRVPRLEREANKDKGQAEKDAKAFFLGKEYRSPVARDTMRVIRLVALEVVKPVDLPAKMRELHKKYPTAKFDEEADKLEKHFEQIGRLKEPA